MKQSNTDIYVCINKVKMIRPSTHPKGCELNLNIDWSIEYMKNDEEILEYVCTINTIGELPLQFAIQGSLESDAQQEDLENRSEELSPLILDKCLNMMMDIVNTTKSSTITLNTIPKIHLESISTDLNN